MASHSTMYTNRMWRDFVSYIYELRSLPIDLLTDVD
jgi:hypothetical protein